MDKGVTIPTAWAVLEVPSQAVEITLSAKVFLDGEIITVQTTFDFETIRNAINEAKDYISPDDIFTLTEAGIEYAKKMGWDDYGKN